MSHEKIVSLLPSNTEVACALGLEDNLIAVSHECDYPHSIVDREQLTSSIIPHGLSQHQIDEFVTSAVREGRSLYAVNGERLFELQPDIVLTQGLCDVCAVTPEIVETSLRGVRCSLSSKCQILSMNGMSLQGICNDLRLLARHTNRQEKAEDLIAQAYEVWNNLGIFESRESLLLLEWVDPFFSAGHWVPEQAQAAGCHSIIGSASEKSRRLSIEEVVASNPAHIAVICCGFGLQENINFAHRLYQMDELQSLPAIQNHQVWAFDANSYFSRPTLRIVRGAELLFDAIHGMKERQGESARVFPPA